MKKNLKKLFSLNKKNSFLQGLENPISIKIKNKTDLNKEFFILNCEIPENKILGTSIGQHIRILKNSKESKSFTPLFNKDQKNEFDILIKKYFLQKHSEKEENSNLNKKIEETSKIGEMSKYLDSLKIGDNFQAIGPKGILKYKENGIFFFRRKNKEKKFKKISIILGGGITPVFQIALYLVKEQNPDLKIKILFKKKEEKEIFFDLLEKDNLSLFENKNVKIRLLTEIKDQVTNEIFDKIYSKKIDFFFLKPSDQHFVLYSGTKTMVKNVKRMLLDKGFDIENIFGYGIF